LKHLKKFEEILNESVSPSLVKQIINDVMTFVKATKDLYEIKGEEAHQFEFDPYKVEDYTEVFNNEVTVNCLIFREENSALQINASAGEENPNIQIVIQIDPRFEPQVYRTLYMKLADDIRHELEHIDQYEKRPDIFTPAKTRAAINRNPKKMMQYFLMPEEIEAMVSGMYNRAKKERRTLDSIFREYLGYYVREEFITPLQQKQVIDKWTEYANKRFPKAQFDNITESMNHLKSYGKFTDVHYKIFESTELDLREILLELQDLGYRVIHDDDILLAVTGESGNVKAIVVRDNTNPSDWIELPWSELKEYALRIKDYLGDKFLSFQWRKIIGGMGENPYKTIELNDDTEINDRIWSFVIKYKE
jgi:hypothetical protein